MNTSSSPLNVDAAQVRAFRAHRGLLGSERAPDAPSAARRLLGTQAQVLTCGLHALALRTEGTPTLKALKRALERDRTLARTWGQRDTLHLYAPEDLEVVIGCRAHWKRTGRRGGAPPDEVLEAMAGRFAAASEPLTRTDIIPHLPSAFVRALEELAASSNMDAERLAASRVLEALAARGDIVFATKKGREQGYAHRERWFQRLPWSVASPDDACRAATRRFMQAFGPVSVDDLSYHMGANKADVRRWMQGMMSEVLHVECEGFAPMMLLEDDQDLLLEAHPPPALRMLPAYDTVLMGHKDKRWLLHDPDEYGQVWKRAAVVSAVILNEGLIVGTWTQKKRTKHVRVELHPLSGWRAEMWADAQKEALRYAQHLELELEDVQVRPLV